MGVMGMAVKRVKAHFGPEAKLRSQRGARKGGAPGSRVERGGPHIDMGHHQFSHYMACCNTKKISVCVMHIKYPRPAPHGNPIEGI